MIVTPAETVVTLKGRDPVEFSCDICGKHFFKTKREYRSQLSLITGNKYKGVSKKHACSRECLTKIKDMRTNVNCGFCSASILKTAREIRDSKSGLVFCNSSCAASYNTTHKTKGTRVSKLEVWLASELTRLYPETEIHFNRKDAIESELDIYIPSLKLAFELNGIFHYEPIYGAEKLGQIQSNDRRKFAACAERGIGLCIIDTSKQTYFKPASSQKYLDIIVKIINDAISAIPTKSTEVVEVAVIETASEKPIP